MVFLQQIEKINSQFKMQLSYLNQDTAMWETAKCPLPVQLQFQNYLVLGKDKSSKKLKQLALLGSSLYYLKNEDTMLVSNTANFWLEWVYCKKAGNGLRLSHNREAFEFYGDVEPIYSTLAKHCIQKEFTQSYSMLKMLAEGGHAKVYQAKKKGNHENFAVKVFQKDKLVKPTDKDSIRKELEILRLMTHPQVIALRETYESETFIFVVMELIKGKDLQSQMGRNFQVQEILEFGCCTLSALTYLHSVGIMHRDITPKNILVKDGLKDVVLIDFGLADRHRPDGHYLFTRCGTPGYIAPEVYTHYVYDYKVDVYGLGMILKQLMQRVQFDGAEFKQKTISKSRIKSPEHLQFDQINEIVDNMLQAKPQYRHNAQSAYLRFKMLMVPKISSCSVLSGFRQIQSDALSTSRERESNHESRTPSKLEGLILPHISPSKPITHCQASRPSIFKNVFRSI